MGAVVGGLLARGGRDVVLWDINAPHVTAINKHGLRLDLPGESATIAVPACRPDEGEDADVILVLTKTLDTEAALAGIRDRIDRGARVVGLQNGLGNDAIMGRHVPPERLFYGCTLMPGRYLAPGHVSTQGAGTAVFRAVRDGEDARGIATEVEGFALIHDQAGADRVIWQKAAFNCAMNAIMALQGGTMGDLADNAEGVALARGAAAEVVAVAQAKGIQADLAAVEAHISRSLSLHRGHKPSMLQDIEAARVTEIDALCGAVAAEAERLGVSAPINKTLAVLVRLKSNVQRGHAA